MPGTPSSAAAPSAIRAVPVFSGIIFGSRCTPPSGKSAMCAPSASASWHAAKTDSLLVGRRLPPGGASTGSDPRQPEEEAGRREPPEVLAGEEAREAGQLGRHDHRIGEPVRVVGRDDRRLALDQARRAGHVDPPEDDLHDDPGQDLQEPVGGRSLASRLPLPHEPDGTSPEGATEDA